MLIAAARTTSEGGDAWKVIVPLIAAGIAFASVMIKLWRDACSARRERLRELYAGGWAAVQAYKEMTFAVRRRNIEDRAGERVRLSEAMREIQKDLSYHDALIGERSGRVATEYRNLVADTRDRRRGSSSGPGTRSRSPAIPRCTLPRSPRSSAPSSSSRTAT